ncbi:hypothetical protein [Siccirubricoccus phaeus]|uniref:hypothetical protein n=1 Tax=Siccirubricoccus phaeus TaxID=2595053 RepID=UPI0011F30F57|nr:hypothetical protein [Siccirubricoccus phaeus]
MAAKANSTASRVRNAKSSDNPLVAKATKPKKPTKPAPDKFVVVPASAAADRGALIHAVIRRNGLMDAVSLGCGHLGMYLETFQALLEAPINGKGSELVDLLYLTLENAQREHEELEAKIRAAQAALCIAPVDLPREEAAA